MTANVVVTDVLSGRQLAWPIDMVSNESVASFKKRLVEPASEGLAKRVRLCSGSTELSDTDLIVPQDVVMGTIALSALFDESRCCTCGCQSGSGWKCAYCQQPVCHSCVDSFSARSGKRCSSCSLVVCCSCLQKNGMSLFVTAPGSWSSVCKLRCHIGRSAWG
eukprot:TRINITY_DN1956_c1_g1_i3.p1 TRINITY_DN1956_c1_g1~~TRINITY_DN1956_c1_g1_i3.p1  ORF type:complete len:163 (-),score=25.33 TRINITY_DN1956_c1_g1_i3:93-581(-)